MLGPKFGPCYLQSSILNFLGRFGKDLQCHTRIGLFLSKHLFVRMCGPNWGADGCGRVAIISARIR